MLKVNEENLKMLWNLISCRDDYFEVFRKFTGNNMKFSYPENEIHLFLLKFFNFIIL